jgi:hypothetical protein
MDFADTFKLLADRVNRLRDNIQTEEATKNALIMPFIQTLGYDVFNPLEVVPEYITDVGIKKGEKIDYAIFKDGHPAILIECKHWRENLDLHDGQLLRYFHVSKAKFGILTNGIVYRFYTDLEDPNKMDEKPFLQFDITALKDAHIEELKKFHKSYYNPEQIFNTASDLKHMNALRELLSNELREPSEKFIRFMAGDVYSGRVTERIVEQFRDLLKRSFQQLVSDMVTERLKSALQKEATEAKEIKEEQEAKRAAEEAAEAKTVDTTAEELEAFYLVKALLHPHGYGSRVSIKDNLSYCSALLDGSVRKTVCRFYFNNAAKKYVVIYDTGAGTRIDIAMVDQLHEHTDKLLSAVKAIEAGRKAGGE